MVTRSAKSSYLQGLANMENSPTPLNEQERRGLGRECLAAYIVARLQSELLLEDIETLTENDNE